MVATITNIEYVATVDIQDTTPLGTSVARTVEVDNIIVTFSVASVVDHQLHFKPEAIGNRMVGYSLEAEQAAVESLVREVVFAGSPDLLPADPANRVDVNGGVDERIGITWDCDPTTVLSDATITERIVTAQEQFASV